MSLKISIQRKFKNSYACEAKKKKLFTSQRHLNIVSSRLCAVFAWNPALASFMLYNTIFYALTRYLLVAVVLALNQNRVNKKPAQTCDRQLDGWCMYAWAGNLCPQM